MKSAHLAIFVAIDAIYDEIPHHRSRYWHTPEGSLDLTRQVLAVVKPPEELVALVVKSFDNYGKRPVETRQLVDVAKRDGPCCRWRAHRPDIECSDDLTVEHIIPRSRGGSDDLRNLWVSCLTHNTRRGNMPIEEFIAEGMQT